MRPDRAAPVEVAPVELADGEPEPAGSWRVFIETSARLQTLLDEDLRARTGMSLADYSLLLILHESDGGRLRMRDLASRMVFSTSRLSYQVDVLVRRGWLVRERADEDRRGSYAVLTAAGRRAFRAAAVHHARAVDELFLSALRPSDGRALHAVMDRLAGHLAGG